MLAKKLCSNKYIVQLNQGIPKILQLLMKGRVSSLFLLRFCDFNPMGILHIHALKYFRLCFLIRRDIRNKKLSNGPDTAVSDSAMSIQCIL